MTHGGLCADAASVSTVSPGGMVLACRMGLCTHDTEGYTENHQKICTTGSVIAQMRHSSAAGEKTDVVSAENILAMQIEQCQNREENYGVKQKYPTGFFASQLFIEYGNEKEYVIPGSGTWEHVEETWYFTKEDIAKTNDFREQYGYGSSKVTNYLEMFLEWFGHCKK